jgi:hypothetical protein
LQFQSSALLAACLGGGNPLVAADPVCDPGLLARLAAVPDPRGRQGRRYALATLLALGVCAMTAPGHDSVAAIAQWARQAGDDVLARLGVRFDPLRGAYQVPDEKTLRDAYARVDAAALAKAGFARLAALAEAEHHLAVTRTGCRSASSAGPHAARRTPRADRGGAPRSPWTASACAARSAPTARRSS